MSGFAPLGNECNYAPLDGGGGIAPNGIVEQLHPAAYEVHKIKGEDVLFGKFAEEVFFPYREGGAGAFGAVAAGVCGAVAEH